MKIVKAYNSVSLVLRIVIGMVIGAALALIIPNAAETAPGIGILGTLFVGALKAIAPLLVFILIISALAQSREKMGKQFGTVIVLYLVSTFLAAVIAVIASFIFPSPSRTQPPTLLPTALLRYSPDFLTTSSPTPSAR